MHACLKRFVTPLLLAIPLSAIADVSDYSAEIRTTSYGISHIKASDWGSLGFGYGYVYAGHNLCILAREVVEANGRQSYYFGESTNRKNQDFFYTMVNNDEFIDFFLTTVSEQGRALVQGYAAGYNRYLSETGVDNLPEVCRGEPWVREIDERDLLRVYYKLILRASAGQLIGPINAAAPPTLLAPVRDNTVKQLNQRILTADPAPLRDLRRPFDLGSNMYALGANATQSGHGMVLGNPHFPWRGPLRWYEIHLTIPGELNVMGASLQGVPLVNIGFNENVAWSHTVSPAWRFAMFELELVPGNPRQYVYDGKATDFEEHEVTIEVTTGRGVETRSHTFYRSHQGWVADFQAFFGFSFWGTGVSTFALGDANEDNLRAIEQFLFMNLAGSLDEFVEVLKSNVGLPWVHTVAADRDGNAFYGDISVVPNVDAQKLADCPPRFFGGSLSDLAGLVVLDGSRSECRFDNDPDAPQEGIIGRSNLPSIQSQDYVTNSNDNHWLSNPDTPLEGFSPLFGDEQTARSLRTRLGIVQVQERLAGSDGLGPVGYTLETLQAALFGSRNLTAELILDDLVALCEDAPPVDLGGQMIDVGPACDVLANWDKRQNIDSVGPQVMVEFMESVFADEGDPIFGSLFEVPFDVNDPVYTPRDFADGDEDQQAEWLRHLATGVKRLSDNGIAIDSVWGDIHFEEKNGVRYPIHGGRDGTGMFSIITTSLESGLGYTPVDHGNSYMQTVTWDDDGIVADALLSYSQSSDPDNANYADQTELYSKKEWVRLPFTEAEIEADPNYRTFTLTGPRVIDSDNDGVFDSLDNCTETANPAQRDTDGDGYGNYCDPDFNQDLVVNFADLAYLKQVFMTTDPDGDLNGDGMVNFDDLDLMRDRFYTAPGPSCLTE